MTSKRKKPATKTASAPAPVAETNLISETNEDRIARSFADLDRAVREQGFQSETDWGG